MADLNVYTLHIDAEECIGTSLTTINQNFLHLDVGVQGLSSSLEWVTTNQPDLSSAITWVNDSSADLETSNTWVLANSSNILHTVAWAEQSSSNINSSSTQFIAGSSTLFSTNTWVKRNSANLIDLINTKCYTKSGRNSIYTTSVLQRRNTISGLASYSALLAGDGNWLAGDNSVLIGGYNNTLSADKSVIVGGQGNNLHGSINTIVGGASHSLSGNHNFIGGGSFNIVKYNYGTIAGGFRNTVASDYSGILGGVNNKANHTNTFILGSNITTSIPDATYVNNLVIKDTPPIDNGTSSLLLRDYNGIICTKVVPNLGNIEPLFAWVQDNSSAFLNASYVQQATGNILGIILEAVDITVLLPVETWVTTNSAAVTKKYTTTFTTTAVNQIETFAHNLSTRDVVIQCYNNNTGSDAIVYTTRHDSISASIDFSTNTPDTYTLIFIG